MINNPTFLPICYCLPPHPSICLSMNKIIPGCAVAAQDRNHIWLLYVNNNDAREKLLLAGLQFDIHTVALHASDLGMNLRKQSERVIIKDIT